MPNTLTPDQVTQYYHDGFLAPIAALSPEEVSTYRAKLERFETALGGPLTSPEIDSRYRFRTHTLLSWVSELVRHPAILDATEDLIGPDILVYMCTWFIKEPGSEAITVWHQDATYFGLRPHLHVTAWVALSDATAGHGCMEFLPASLKMGQLQHRAFAHKNSINGGGQRAVIDINEEQVVSAPLRAGEFSFHHTLCLHRSQPNRTHERRIGLAISYVPAHVEHIGSAHQPPAMLVRGTDRYGHFEHERTPEGDFDAASREAHAGYYARYRTNYNEQVELMSHAEPA
ncbi:MAG: phytanoyl-CoA dioxygenase family protein [Candidatus Tectomicrobia bacterium]|nr:phytanoyl-CoA dioxygenase family protein [Candidatus Tectomicrobia bacterium]